MAFKKIDSHQNFLVILTPGALDDCKDPEDWMTKEISHAVGQKKRIIPIVTEEFSFPPPDKLPGSLAELPRYQAVVYSHLYFKASIDKLVDFLRQVSQK